MHTRWLLPTIIVAASVSGCTLMGAGRPHAGASGTQGAATPAGSVQPAPPGSAAGQPAAAGGPGAATPRQFRLGSAATALVGQAHQQSAAGDQAQAAATLERALRIEPQNPLLWIELGRIRLAENNAVQADAMGRKALALATGDPEAEASAWRLIADAMRASGRNADASEADRQAAAAVAR
jgi:tetratricopeptide (TPR) repeat protein